MEKQSVEKARQTGTLKWEMPSLWVRKTLWFFVGLFVRKDLKKERKGKDEG
jgi:hypothetical protein